jgi:two-component system NarL family response regulator
MRVAIVEDERNLLEGLRIILGGEPDITVVGAYASAEEAIVKYKDASPDVMIVDLKLPGMSGIELIKRVKADMPEIDIMVHTAFSDMGNLVSAIKAGAAGYILKGCRPSELVDALYDLSNGGAPMSPKAARAVITALQSECQKGLCILTKREREILQDIDAGLTYKEIAEKVCLSPHTVRTHIRNIYEKLHVRNKQEALLKAHKTGLLAPFFKNTSKIPHMRYLQIPHGSCYWKNNKQGFKKFGSFVKKLKRNL